MKALNNLTNTEKGKFLYELFPEEMPTLIDHLKEVCIDLKTHHEEYRSTWDFGLMTFDMWLSLAEQTEILIKKHRAGMIKSSRVFSDQLFFSYTALFVNDRIIKYADGVTENHKFKLAVEILYNP